MLTINIGNLERGLLNFQDTFLKRKRKITNYQRLKKKACLSHVTFPLSLDTYNYYTAHAH